jgi:predicted acetyltransferase
MAGEPSPPQDVRIRPARRDELGTFLRSVILGFGGDPPPPDPRAEEDLAATLEPERTRCAFDGADMVATLGSYGLQLAVPGGALPMGGTTMVTVRPTHRRRGILRALMAAHLSEVRERGETLAGLWASESSIYERFGYGCAAHACRIELPRAHAGFSARAAAPGGRCRLLEREEARRVLPELYERVWRARPGHFARSAAWWETRQFADPPGQRDGMSALRRVVYERDGEARGYLQYRQRAQSDPAGTPSGRLRVVELQALDADAHAGLWRFALDVDLIGAIEAPNAAPDDPLPWLLADPRRALRSTRDSLWLRILDVPLALAGRRYAAEGRVVLEVRDPLPAGASGRYALEAGPEGARCAPSSQPADLHLGVSDLAAVLLGGTRLGALARAGRVTGDAGALARADRMFAWDPAPWCPEHF